ncbi:MAG: hypothetical protein PHP44_11270 [Kiritimatiellae bacterium]|nr:hypothetical protein [Kiritimatiellia bacterium]
MSARLTALPFATLTLAILCVLQGLPNAASAQQPGQPEAKVPELQWFRGASGYEKAIELQKATGADIFVVFYREGVASEKGLYRWMKTKGFESSLVHNALRDYIKVKVELNKKAHERLAIQEFNVKKTPAVYVVWPNGWNKRCNFFDWDGKRPKLLDPEKMVEELRKNSSSSDQKTE